MKSGNEMNFIAEGYADIALLAFFGIPVKKRNRAAGIHGVAASMKNQQKYFHKTLVGFVDADKKNTPRYFDEFKKVDERDGLSLHTKLNTKQHLITLHPAFEQWLINSASSVELKPSGFGLPDDLDRLIRVTKRDDIGKNQDFLDLLQAIRKAKAPSFVTLQAWLKKPVKQQ